MNKTILYAGFALCALAISLPEVVSAQGVVVGSNCKIQWNSNVESDLAKYTITGTLTPAVGAPVTKALDVLKPAVAAPTVSTTCLAMGLTTGGTLAFTVEAVDTLGNRSIKSLVATASQDVIAPVQPTGLTITPNP